MFTMWTTVEAMRRSLRGYRVTSNSKYTFYAGKGESEEKAGCAQVKERVLGSMNHTCPVLTARTYLQYSRMVAASFYPPMPQNIPNM